MMMKRYFFFLLIILFAYCNGVKQENTPAATPVTHTHAEHPTDKLKLHEGATWRADSTTKMHVSRIQKVLESFTATQHNDTASYHSLSAAMQAELNGLISDCKMTGEDHEALHEWLEPVLEKVSGLKKVQSAADGATAVTNLSDDMIKFHQHFN